MKKYLRMLPVILFPYFYIIIIFVAIAISNTFDISEGAEIWIGIIVLYVLLSFLIAIVNAVQTAKMKGGVGDAVKINAVVKLVQIPAYIFHFLLGVLGLLMGIFGIGFWLFAIFIDLVTIILTGISAVGCAIRMYKDGYIKLCTSIFMGIGSFMFCIDVVIAILYIVMLKTHEKIPKGIAESVKK